MNAAQQLPYEHHLCNDYDVDISYDHPPPDAHAHIIKMRTPVLLVNLKSEFIPILFMGNGCQNSLDVFLIGKNCSGLGISKPSDFKFCSHCFEIRKVFTVAKQRIRTRTYVDSLSSFRICSFRF